MAKHKNKQTIEERFSALVDEWALHLRTSANLRDFESGHTKSFLKLVSDLRYGKNPSDSKDPLLAQALRTIIDASRMAGHFGHLFELRRHFSSYLLDKKFETYFTTEDSHDIGMQILSQGHLQLFASNHDFFKATCRKELSQLRNVYKIKRHELFKESQQRFIDRAENASAPELWEILIDLKKKCRLDKRRMNRVGRAVINHLFEIRDITFMQDFVLHMKAKSTIGNITPILSETQAKAIAQSFLTDDNLTDYVRFTRKYSFSKDIIAALDAEYDTRLPIFLDKNAQAAAQTHREKRLDDVFKAILLIKETLNLESSGLQIWHDQFLDHSLNSNDPLAILHFLQASAYHQIFKRVELSSDHAKTLAESLTRANQPHAVLSLYRHLTNRYPQLQDVVADYTDITPAADKSILQSLAAILDPEQDNKEFLNALILMHRGDIIKAQADDLSPVWMSLEASNKDHADEHTLSAKKLKRMFLEVGRYNWVTQMQRPVIMPMSYDPSLSLHENLHLHYGLEGHKTGIFSDKFGAAKLLHAPEGALDYQFNFMGLRTRHKTVKGRDELLVLPVLKINDDMFRTVQNSGDVSLFKHLQEISACINHDYAHALTASLLAPYYGVNTLWALKYGSTPHALALGYKDAFPYQNLPQVNRTYDKDSQFMPQYKEAGGYEGHILHAQKLLYARYRHNTPYGEKLMDHIHDYFDSLEKLSDKMTALNGLRTSEMAQIYFASLVYHHLLYMVPYTHPILQLCEERTAQLPVSQETLQSAIHYSLPFANVDSPSHLRDATNTSYLSLSDMSKKQAIRIIAHGDRFHLWDDLHYAGNEKANETALPDLRKVFCLSAQDMAQARNAERERLYDRWRSSPRRFEVKSLRKSHLAA
ncbi:MAG TPA: hypothetical protein VIN59_00695 [Alphaproteobacteria bacterium]